LEGLTGANVANRPLVVRLFQPGTETQVGSPFNATTDAQGNFTVNNLPTGTFDIDVKNANRLSRRAAGVAIPASGSFSRAFGQLLAGDVDGGNFVNLLDYSALQASFFLEQGDTGYNALADFNGDNGINLQDYAFLQGNFFAEGPLPAGVTGSNVRR
jgi:hypothetical protein